MAVPIIPIALGALAVWALSQQSKTPAFQPVEAKNGRKWLTRTLSVTGSGPTKQTVVEVWAPAGSFGPHLDMLVATYRQLGSDTNSRVALSTGQGVPDAMITAAGQDFGIRKPT